jgi:hypothetical protein
MSKQIFPHSIEITGSQDIDKKYRVANDAARNLLITNQAIQVGHVIFHEADGLRYKLETYPTAGSLTGVVWKRVTPALSSALNSGATDVAANSKAVKDLKDLIDNLSFLDESNPPTFIDSNDADNYKDSIRFTFTGGATIDISIKDLVDLGALNNASKRSASDFILDFTTLGGTTVSVDVTAWFATKNDVDKITINGNKFTLIKHPTNAGAKTLLETNDVIIDGFWDNNTYWGKAKYLGGGATSRTNYLVLDEIDLT